MWDEGLTYCLIGLGVIAALLSFKYWGTVFYAVTRHARVAGFVCILSLLGAILVLKAQDLKYDIAYYHFTGTENTDVLEAKYHIRQCKEFVEAKLDGRDAADQRSLSTGFMNISGVSNWEFCARTFGLNYWKEDISINGQDGGHLLCEAYAHDTYRSPRVQTWCDTVFATRAVKGQKI